MAKKNTRSTRSGRSRSKAAKRKTTASRSPGSLHYLLWSDITGQLKRVLIFGGSLLIAAAGGIFISNSTGQVDGSSGSLVQDTMPAVLIDEPSVDDVPIDILEDSQSKFRKGELIVKFKEEVKEKIENVEDKDPDNIGIDSVDELNKKNNVQSVKQVIQEEVQGDVTTFQDIDENGESLGEKDISTIVEIDFPLNTNLEEIADDYQNDPNVEYAEPNFMVETLAVPNDPYYSTSGAWGQSFDDLYGLKKLDSEQAWDITKGSDSAIVAVIDTGVDYNHEDLQGNIWTNTDEIPGNGIDDDNNGYVDDIHGYDFVNRDGDPIDDHGHGTHCSGTIAATSNNGKGVAGVAWDTQIMGVKFLSAGGSGSISNSVLSVYYAVDNGAKVLSNSWGGWGASQGLQDAINYARDNGVLFVGAAGNSNADAANYQPAGLDNVVTVAAVDSNDRRASFSSYGQVVEVSAPGVQTLSLRANGTSMGRSVGSKYTVASGTSMATPHVAGIAALAWANNPDATPDMVEQQIIGGVDEISSDKYIGAGRVNSYGSLTHDVNSPNIVVESVSIDDSASGNQNNAIDPGETVDVVISLKNKLSDATGVRATLTTSDGFITMQDSTANYGDMASGITKDNGDDTIRMRVSSEILRGRDISFSLAIRANGGEYTKTIPLTQTISRLTVSGTITEDTIWVGDGTEYLVTGDITVAEGATLDVRAGAKVYFEDYYELRVEGTLYVNGTRENMALFTTANDPNDSYWWGEWKEIIFASGSTGSVNYAQIENAVVGLHADDSSPTISNNILRNNHVGFIIGSGSDSNVVDNVVALNTYGSLMGGYRLNGYYATVYEGIQMSPRIERNVITNNLYYSVYSYLRPSASPLYRDNDFLPHTYYRYAYTGFLRTFYLLGYRAQGHIIDASANYWGTSDQSVIEYYIHDANDTSVVGKGSVSTTNVHASSSTDKTDTDGDGISDMYEWAYDLDPNQYSDRGSDKDSDGISNLDEYRASMNPDNSDTDSDRTSDRLEKQYGFDSLNVNSPRANHRLSYMRAGAYRTTVGSRIDMAVVLRNHSYRFVSGEKVTVSASRSGDQLVQPRKVSNATGEAHAFFVPAKSGRVTITAQVASENNLKIDHSITIYIDDKERSQVPVPKEPEAPADPTPKPKPKPKPVPPADPAPQEADEIFTAPHSDHQSLVRMFDEDGSQRGTEFNAFDPEFNVGTRIDVGDVDGDGEDEVVVGGGPGAGPHVRVFEKNGNATSTQFFPFHPKNRDGVDVAVGDIDGDGQSEIAVSQYQNQESWVKVYRTDSKRTIVGEWIAFGRGIETGASIAMADVDNDGKAEVIIGAGKGGGPHILIYEANGTRLPHNFFAFHPKNRSGIDVAGCDLDGDGQSEIIASQRGGEEAWIKTYQVDKKRTVMGTWRAYPQGVTSGANVSCTDLDEDGKAEVLVGPGPGYGPRVKTYQANGTLVLPIFWSYNRYFDGGVDVAGQ